MFSDITLIVTAAGTSSRFGENKIFLEVQGQPLIVKTLSCFAMLPFKKIIVTHHKDSKDRMLQAIKRVSFLSPVELIEGGHTRKESVQQAVLKADAEYVLIHDGARPKVSQELIQRIVVAKQSHPAIIPGLRLTDTIKWVENGQVKHTVDRNFLYKIQTPQLFKTDVLSKAYDNSQDNVTDEAMVCEASGIPVFVVDGDEVNIKLTFQKDINFL